MVRLSASMAVIALCAAAARADWTAINLTPTGAYESRVYAVTTTTQYGTAGFSTPPTYLQASAWSGSAASWTSLSQPGAGGQIYGTDGLHQVGAGPGGPGGGAVLWTGTAASLTTLHPTGAYASQASAVSGDHQYGWTYVSTPAQKMAAMWSGSAASYVNMNPPGASYSVINAAAGNLQGGTVAFPSGTGGGAGIWSGTPDSYVSLHPGGPWTGSVINGMSGTDQVGAVYAPPSNFPRAGLWRGTAASFVLMDPSQAGGYSELLATCGTAQVGYIAPASGVYAGIWFGTADSFLNLGQFLPSGVYDESRATSIATDGVNYYVGGYAENATTLRNEAFLWIGPVPAPGTLSALAGCLFVAARRRRR
jgi:hypothetical protein